MALNLQIGNDDFAFKFQRLSLFDKQLVLIALYVSSSIFSTRRLQIRRERPCRILDLERETPLQPKLVKGTCSNPLETPFNSIEQIEASSRKTAWGSDKQQRPRSTQLKYTYETRSSTVRVCNVE